MLDDSGNTKARGGRAMQEGSGLGWNKRGLTGLGRMAASGVSKEKVSIAEMLDSVDSPGIC